ncbi:DUF6328 family protein [Citricoccus nitrophenolicus]|uniref:DUF6328 family protein n=1 Tax=Citricoccus nitrophenolicus TaxID=863575 RepID=UPI003D768054
MDEHVAGAPGPVFRRETLGEKQDRNWNDLLQELRVVQTGTQIVTAFLMTLPFQSRFDDLAACVAFIAHALVDPVAAWWVSGATALVVAALLGLPPRLRPGPPGPAE